MAAPFSVIPNSGLASGPEEAKQEDAPRPPRKYGAFISTLPLEERWSITCLREYQGFWFPEGPLSGVMAFQGHFKARPSDVFITSYPKSGTTWLKGLAFAVMTRNQYPLSQNPLLSLNPHVAVPLLEMAYFAGDASMMEAMPSPRILNTHLPYSMLPESIISSGCRTVHVCRDPKDVLVSHWIFSGKLYPKKAEGVPFSQYYETFCDGRSPWGPIWENVLGYWNESLRSPEKVLLLTYENMLKDPVGNTKRLAEFMECPFSEGEEKEGVVEEIIKLCSFEKMKNLEVNKTEKRKTTFAPHNSFFRKGEAGDWKNHMNAEIARRLDEITRQKLQEAGLTFACASWEAAV